MATFRGIPFTLRLEGDLAPRAGYEVAVSVRPFIGTSGAADIQYVTRGSLTIQGEAHFTTVAAWGSMQAYATALPPTAGTLIDDYGGTLSAMVPWMDARAMRTPNGQDIFVPMVFRESS